MNKLVLLMEPDAPLRRRLNAGLLRKGLEVWPVPDEVSAHQVLNIDGSKIAVAVVSSADDAKLQTLTARARSLNPDLRVVCCCRGATETPRKGCGGVIWPRGGDPELLADLVQALIEDEALPALT